MVLSHGQISSVLHQRFVATEHGGVVCVLSGSPGTGKTRLAERFLAELPESIPKLRGRGLQSGVAPLLPICDAIRSYQHGIHHDQLRAVAEEYATAVPVLKEVLGPLVRARGRTLHSRADLGQVIPPETYTFIVLTRLIAALEGDETPVIFVDDIQWIDASSQAFLGYFASQIRSQRVFLLLVRRQNGHVDSGTQALLETLRRDSREATIEMVVGGLSRPEQLELISAMLGPVALDEEQLAWLEALSQAKPYYLRELIELLRQRGFLVQHRGEWRLVERPGIIIPPSMHQYIGRRIRRACESHPLARDILQFGACAGTRFDARDIANAMGESVRRVGQVSQIIERDTELVRRDGKTTMFSFDHDITRDSVLEDLGDFALEIHGKLASVLANRERVAPASVAIQFEAAAQWTRAAEWYLTAATSAFQQSHVEAALQWGTRADRLLSEAGLAVDEARRVSTLTVVAQALFGAERYAEVVAHLRERMPAVEGDATIRLRHLLGRACARLPDAAAHREAVDHLQTALKMVGPDHERLRVEILTDLVNAYDIVADFAASQAVYRNALISANRAGDQAALVRLMRLSCIFWQPEKVVETIQRAFPIATRLGLQHELAYCANNIGSAYFALGQLGHARIQYQRCDRLLRQLGGYRRDTPLNNLGVIHMIEGEFEQAESFLTAAMQESCDVHTALFIRSHLAVLSANRGDLSKCIAQLETAVADADATGDLFFRDCLRHNLANALIAVGRPEQALMVIESCPLHHSHGDELLVEAKRAQLVIRALTALGKPIKPVLLAQAELLQRTTKPQAWLYRMPWYVCDIEFWED